MLSLFLVLALCVALLLAVFVCGAVFIRSAILAFMKELAPRTLTALFRVEMVAILVATISRGTVTFVLSIGLVGVSVIVAVPATGPATRGLPLVRTAGIILGDNWIVDDLSLFVAPLKVIDDRVDRGIKSNTLPHIHREFHNRYFPEGNDEVQRFVVVGPRNLSIEKLFE